MRFCLSERQPKDILINSGEIMLHWVNRARIFDLIEAFPHIYLTIDCPSLQREENFKELEQYIPILKDRLQLCLSDEKDIVKAKEIGAKYFLKYLVRDFYTLNRYIDLGVCAARITAPLTHNFEALSKLKDKIELRIFPNKPGIKATKNVDGLTGGWFRPEDIDSASFVISVIEFDSSDTLEREQALFRIYSQKKVWPGELNILIDEINDRHIINDYIPPEFGERRSKCGQRCQQGSGCHYCNIIATMATEKFVKSIKEQYKN